MISDQKTEYFVLISKTNSVCVGLWAWWVRGCLGQVGGGREALSHIYTGVRSHPRHLGSRYLCVINPLVDTSCVLWKTGINCRAFDSLFVNASLFLFFINGCLNNGQDESTVFLISYGVTHTRDVCVDL